MRLFGGKKKPLTRREIVAQRRVSDAESETADVSSFQRSRTLSVRKDLSRDEQPSERQAAWDLRRKRRKLVRWLGVSLLMVTGIFLLLTQMTATISVQTTGAVSADRRQEYAKLFEDYLGARPIERLRFMINQTALRAFFLEKAPELQSVQVAGGSKLTESSLQISFRQPVAQWSSGGKIYFVDGEGVTFENNYFPSPKIIVKDQSGVPASAGQEVINRRFLSFLGQAVSLFGQNGLPVAEAILPPGTVRQVEFRLDGRSYAIKMTVDRTAQAQVQEALRAMQFVDSRQLSPGYIDVRVDQRVFYK